MLSIWKKFLGLAISNFFCLYVSRAGTGRHVNPGRAAVPKRCAPDRCSFSAPLTLGDDES